MAAQGDEYFSAPFAPGWGQPSRFVGSGASVERVLARDFRQGRPLEQVGLGLAQHLIRQSEPSFRAPVGAGFAAESARFVPAQLASRGATPEPAAHAAAPAKEIRKSMEERTNAQIERLPENKQAEPRARMEEGRKMFAEMANLAPE